MRHIHAVSTRIVIGAIVAVTAPASVQQQQQQQTPAECAARLLDSFRSEYGFPALAVAVTRGDTVLFNVARGSAHIELGVPATPSTLFQLSSTTRVFTSVLALRMAVRGLIDLDGPVTAYLDEAPPGWNRITLRHLLANTAALPNLAAEADPADDASAQTILADLYERAPAPEPEVAWSYNITEYLVLQQILERVGGARLPRLMQAWVFEPAGMTTATYWPSSNDVVAGAATGYYPDSTVTPRRYVHRQYVFPEYLLSAAGAAASLEDLIRFDAALRDGRLLSAELRDSMWRDIQLQTGRTVSYGLGWDMATHAPGHRSAGHSGGMLTTFRTYPGSRLTAIVLTNGFLQPVNHDDVATAFAAVWDPAIVGFTAPACNTSQLAGAEY